MSYPKFIECINDQPIEADEVIWKTRLKKGLYVVIGEAMGLGLGKTYKGYLINSLETGRGIETSRIERFNPPFEQELPDYIKKLMPKPNVQ